MSKNMQTAASNKLKQDSMRRAIEDCSARNCEFCAWLQESLDAANEPNDLHIEVTG